MHTDTHIHIQNFFWRRVSRCELSTDSRLAAPRLLLHLLEKTCVKLLKPCCKLAVLHTVHPEDSGHGMDPSLLPVSFPLREVGGRGYWGAIR